MFFLLPRPTLEGLDLDLYDTHYRTLRSADPSPLSAHKMGGASSSSFLSTWVDLLARLGGSDPIAYDDPFWRHLLNAPDSSFLAEPYYLAADDPHDLAAVVEPNFRRMVENNPSTHNCQALLIHTISLLTEVSSAWANGEHGKISTDEDEKRGAVTAAAANALHMFGYVIRLAAEGAAASPAEFSALFEVPPSLPLPPSLVRQGAEGGRGSVDMWDALDGSAFGFKYYYV